MTLMDAILLVIIVGVVSGPLSRLAINNMKATSQSMMIGEVITYAEGSMEEVVSVANNSGVSNIISGFTFNFTPPDHISRSLVVSELEHDEIPYVQVDLTVTYAQYSCTLTTLFRAP